MCALRGGRSVETTMGFSTLAGLSMGTPSGDLDPGIILYLLAETGMTVDEVQYLFHEESGLLGISGCSRNMEDLLGLEAVPDATEAIEFFCYQARRQLAALTASLEGLDRLVFTGGIGANAPVIRSKICAGLGYLGIALAPRRNASGARFISADSGGVAVEAFGTDEESADARHVRHMMTARNIEEEA